PVWKDSAAVLFWLARKDQLVAADATAEFAKAGEAVSTLTPTLEKIKAWHDKDPKKNLYSEGNTAPYNMNKAGLQGHNSGWDELSSDLRIGVKIKAGNKTVQSYYTDPAYIADLKAMKDWADRGLSNGLVAPTIEQEPQAITVSCAQGFDGAQFVEWGGPIKGYDTMIQKKSGPFLTSGYIQGGINVIGAGSKKPEAALKYMEYCSLNAEYRNMLAYGIEGTNWKQENGAVEILTGQDWAPGTFSQGSFDLLLPGKGCPPTMFKDVCEMTNTATASALLGFVPTTETITNEIATCTSLIQEVFRNLQCGAVKDVDAEVTGLLKKLDAQGYPKIIAEYQTQVDAFLAAKK
ncbi:MAG: ABC transporter substrate-binding protein, partial [Oscillospiraceae bacterium]